MTVTPVHVGDCVWCGAKISVFKDESTGRLILIDWPEPSYHACPQMADETVEKLLRCQRCGEINVAMTNVGRLIEWMTPYPVPPYLDHVCVRQQVRAIPFPRVATPSNLRRVEF